MGWPQDRRQRETEAGAVETTDILLTYRVPEAWDGAEGPCPERLIDRPSRGILLPLPGEQHELHTVCQISYQLVSPDGTS